MQSYKNFDSIFFQLRVMVYASVFSFPVDMRRDGWLVSRVTSLSRSFTWMSDVALILYLRVSGCDIFILFRHIESKGMEHVN